MNSLTDNDELAKYLFKEKEMRADGRPRPNTLKPKTGQMLSMSEVTQLEHIKICKHGHQYVDNASIGRVHIGYVKFYHESLINLQLQTIYDNVKPLHVSVGFPDDDEKRRELAKALADEAIIIDEKSDKKYFADCR